MMSIATGPESLSLPLNANTSMYPAMASIDRERELTRLENEGRFSGSSFKHWSMNAYL